MPSLQQQAQVCEEAGEVRRGRGWSSHLLQCLGALDMPCPLVCHFPSPDTIDPQFLVQASYRIFCIQTGSISWLFTATLTAWTHKGWQKLNEPFVESNVFTPRVASPRDGTPTLFIIQPCSNLWFIDWLPYRYSLATRNCCFQLNTCLSCLVLLPYFSINLFMCTSNSLFIH